jgi:hypothetical protein
MSAITIDNNSPFPVSVVTASTVPVSLVTPSLIPVSVITSIATGSNIIGKVGLSEQIAGEDLVTDVLKVEHRYYSSTLTSATTLAVKATAGFLHRIVIGMPSTPTLSLYDNTVPGGTLIMRLHAGYPVGSHEFNITFNNGLTVDASSGGVSPQVLFAWR